MLTGKYARGGEGRLTQDDHYARRYAAASLLDTGKSLSALATSMGTDPATLAVAWAAAHPSGPSPIISARTPAQLEPSLAALDFTMTPALYDQIAALSPAPPPATDRTEEQ